MKHYSGRERIEAVFKRQYLDRVPVVLGLTAHLAPRAGYTYKECFLDPEKALNVTRLSEEILPTDMVRVPGDPYLPDVSQAREEARLGAVRSERILANKANLKGWHYRPPRENRAWLRHLDMTKRVQLLFPDRAVFVLVPGPWSNAAELRGAQELIYDCFDDPDFVHSLMEVVTKLALERAEVIGETDVYIRFGDPSASCSLISPKLYQEFVKPYHQRLFSELKARFPNSKWGLHMCGYVDPIMEDILSLPLDWFELDAPSSLEKMVALSQGKVVIRGNVPNGVFVEGPRERIEAEVKRCIFTAAKSKAFVLAPGCSVPYNAPVENIKYFLEAVYEYSAS